jgi:hypothetical protein
MRRSWTSSGTVFPFLAVGPNPAQSGSVRLPNNTAISWRNAANNGDIVGITVDSGNNCQLGSTGSAITNITGTASVRATVGATLVWLANTTEQRFLNNAALALTSITTPNYQSMSNGLYITDATTAPTGNPATGHFSWSNSGVPAWRTSAGDICIWNLTTAATATAGGGAAVPATVSEFMTITYKGNTRKIPLFAN